MLGNRDSVQVGDKRQEMAAPGLSPDTHLHVTIKQLL